MKVIKFENESVLIKEGKIKVWVDVWIEAEDVICDWNKNSFTLTNNEDLTLKKWQDNLSNYEDATCLAVKTLEEQGVIFQDKNAKWHSTVK